MENVELDIAKGGAKHCGDAELLVRGQAIKNILVPVDGSECSDRALEFAIDLAKKYSAEICLLHITSTTYTYFPMTPNWEFCPPSFYGIRESEDEGERVLYSALAKVIEAGINSYKVEYRLEYGRPAYKIIQIAKKEGFDLIVIGREDLGAIARFFLGSVTDNVVHNAPCPVLVVR